jgi:hypothetical protein
MAIKGRVEGADTIVKNLLRSTEFIGEQSIRGLTLGALRVNKESKQEVPVREGNLRASGFVVNPTDGEVGSSGAFRGAGAGKAATDHQRFLAESKALVSALTTRSLTAVAVGFSAFYALFVHENPNAGAAGYDPSKDKKGMKARGVHSRVGKYKFLEDPLKRLAGAVKADLAKAVKLPTGKIT